jgi:hypothetical protein
MNDFTFKLLLATIIVGVVLAFTNTSNAREQASVRAGSHLSINGSAGSRGPSNAD